VPGRTDRQLPGSLVVPGFTRHVIRLRFTRPARFRFFHGGVLMGLLCNVLRDHLPPGLIPVVCEMGRVRYEPGQAYHVGVTRVGGGLPGIEEIAAGVDRVGAARPPAGPLPSLGGNFRVEGTVELPPPDLESQVASLLELDRFTVRFVSPFRQRLPRADERKGRTLMGDGQFDLPHFLKRLYNRVFLLNHGRWPDGDERVVHPAIPAPCHASDLRMLQLDAPVKGQPGGDPDAPEGKTPGGFLGRITAAGVPPEWLPIVVAGQYLHAGSKVHYGFGRYIVEEALSSAADGYQAAETLLQRAAAPAALEDACRHVLDHTTSAGIDGVTPEAFDIAAGRLLSEISRSLLDGSYRPRPLLGIVGAAKPGKLRPLTIPTLADRVAQRAAANVLGEAVDTLLEDASFAYRKGLSRSRAAGAVQEAYERGFRWVLDADIADFFDSVPWQTVEDKLDALYPSEPLVRLLMAWVRAPVVFDGRTVERAQGLPQGAVVSPLLANLYLDELDEELLGRDYRLVRYADDFVVLCRDVDEARRAKNDAEVALRRLGLALNFDKTEITTFEHGFTYLGYLFCRSLVLERRKRDEGAGAEVSEDWVPQASWLARVPFDRVRALASLKGAAEAAVEVVGLDATPEIPEPERFPLYVTDPGARLSARGESLVVEGPGSTKSAFPVTEISHLVLIGRTRATVPLLRRLAVGGVPTFLCRATGELEATVAAAGEEWPLWRRQAIAASDATLRLGFARAVVAAKLHNAATLAVRFRFADASTVSGRLRDLERSCLDQNEPDALRGLEGRGAAIFFAAFGRSLPGGWVFARRRRRPPPDPVNAMLSFGYTMLYHHISTALRAGGLDPRVGLFHAEKGAYHALACDLQEELRWLVDGYVWAAIRRRRVQSGDFRRVEGPGACLMTTEARRRFIAGFEERLLTTFTPAGGSPTTYRGYMARQAVQVRDLVTGRSPGYEPFRLRA